MITMSAAEAQEVIDSCLHIKAGTTAIAAYQYKDRKDFNRVCFDSPTSVKSIGEYAFLGCEKLRQIELPASLRKIGEGAFRE